MVIRIIRKSSAQVPNRLDKEHEKHHMPMRLTSAKLWRNIPPPLADPPVNGASTIPFRKGLRHMKRFAAIFGTALLVLPATAAGQVRADYLNWTYSSTLNVAGVSVDAGSNGGASVTLTDVAKAGTGSIPVIAYETQTSSTTPIDFNNSTYNLALKITDGNNASGTLNFTGSLNGALTATTSSVVASFAPVTSNSITFDGHTYTVSIPSLTLAAPTSPQQDIMASVSVANASGGGGPPPPPPPPPPHGTPEPTSLLLAGLGLSWLGAERWWKRRRLTQTIA
jgi:hypothetical protein